MDLRAVLADAGFEVLSAHWYESFGLMDVNGKSEMVTKRDFQWMCQCDVYIALLPPDENCKSIRSDGTCVELGWASALRKPVIIVRSLKGIYSHLILGLAAIAPIIVLDYDEVVRDAALIKDATLDALAI